MNYQMYPNYYIQDLQGMKDRIDNQIKQIQQQNQVQQPQPITQNFQLAPNPSNNELESKYANSIDEVKNTFVIKTGVFINKDFSTLWIKDVTGKIRTFSTQEIIEMDEKDKEIYELKRQLSELKGALNERNSINVDESTTTKKSTRTSSNSKSNE